MPVLPSLLDSVRFASKKAGGSSKNLGGKSPGKRYGFKKQDGINHFKPFTIGAPLNDFPVLPL